MTRGSSDASFFDGHKSDGVEAIRLKFGLSQGAQLRIPPNSSTLAEKNDDDSNTKVQPHPHNASGLTQVPLPTAIGIDIFSALVTAFAVAPGVAIIDKAVISQAAGIDTIGGSVAKCVTDLARNPVKFMRQPNVLVSSVVYLGTFAAANVVEAVCNEMDHPAGMAKFIASSTANMGLSIWKDQAFTRWYSSSAPRALPSSTYTLFALRDGLTMASSFTLPPIVAPIIADALAKHTTTTDSSVLLARAETISQLVLPCAMQLVSTPIHLAALDMYNRPVVAGGMVNRMTTMPFVQNPGDFLKTVGFRCIRILPAFGVGGNLNRSMRSGLRDYYAESRK
ncbi:hypothetical protein BJ742DRAFT_684364 [Cladochytrium replicatum]|nr:hypothetical protein BJ742DRAFT_684364 [Cladochytrium replicatum]